MFSPEPESSTVQKKRFQLLRSSTPDSESSAPQARWDHLRQQILPSKPPETPPSASSSTLRFSSTSTPYLPSTAHAAASTASVITRPPSRSTTPKPSSSRLAFAATKLGFKQVVDHAREAAVDENKRFGEDVLRACWAARSSDPAFHGSKGRGAYGMNADHFIGSAYASSGTHPRTKTTMSSFTSSSTSIPVSATPSASGINMKPGQVSSSSINSGFVSGNTSSLNMATAATTTATPTVRYLHSMLWHPSGASSHSLRSVYLPHESLVLSSLLLPFISPIGSEARIEEERWLSIDVFEVLIKSFEPANELASAERCTWCTQAVSALTTPSPLRSRLLTQLWSLTEPAENKHVVVTPECIKTIASAVFMIFPIILPSSSYPQPQSQFPRQSTLPPPLPNQQQQIDNDIGVAKEILEHLRSGGIVDEDACELEYGMKRKGKGNSQLSWDIKMDSAEVTRKLMVSEASLACLEVCERDVKAYLINNVIQEYWEPLPEISITPIQKSISSNRIKLFCNGSLEGLICAPAYEMRYDLRNMVMKKIIKILQETVVPELTALVGSSPISPSPFSSRLPSSNSSQSSSPLPQSSFPQNYNTTLKGKGKGKAGAKNEENRYRRGSTFSIFGGEGIEEEEEAKRAVIRTLLELVCCIELDNTGGGVYGVAMVFPPTMDKSRNGKWAKDVIENWFLGNGDVMLPPSLSMEDGKDGEGGDEDEWRLDWRNSLKQMLKYLVVNAEWRVVVRVLTGVVEKLGDNVRTEIFRSVFRTLVDRIIQDPPPAYLLTASSHSSSHHAGGLHSRSSSYQSDISLPPVLASLSTIPGSSLTILLQTVSNLLPTIFFKPLFTLSAMNVKSEYSMLSISDALSIVYGLVGVVKDLWVRDDEMVSVALMSDVPEGGAGRSGKKGGDGVKNKRSSSAAGRDGDEIEKNTRGRGERLGQTCVLVELVNKLRTIRRLRDHLQTSGGNTEEIAKLLGGETAKLNLMKFVTGLEVRLAVLIEAKEKDQRISPTQRTLYCILFREIRLLTRSLRPVPWLGIVLRWFEQYFNDWVDGNEWDDEIESVVEEIKEVYVLAKGSVGSSKNRRTTFMVPGSTSITAPTTSGDESTKEEEFNIPAMINETLKLVNSLSRGFVLRIVKLLFTVSTLLGAHDWARVAPIVWRSRFLLLDSDSSSSFVEGKKRKATGSLMPSVCYLVMQCAEKNPLGFRGMVEVDMRSSDDTTRLESVRKLNQLIHWRFQLLSDTNTILMDRTHRPFKLARAPLPFVPTDIGSPVYIHNDNAEEADPIWALHHATTRAKAKTKIRKAVGGAGMGSHSVGAGGAGGSGFNGGGSGAVGGRTVAATKNTIPVELKKQLVEIGWVNDDGEGDEKEIWIRTPISMLPVDQIEKLDMQRSPNHRQQRPTQHDLPPNSPQQSNNAGTSQVNPLMTSLNNKGTKLDADGAGELLRRNSSSGGPTYAKRRAVFVPQLSLIFKILAMMVYDSNFSVAAAARDTLIDLMRNDSALLLRPILDLFCGEQGQENPGARDSQEDVAQAVNILTALLHAKHMLPPPMVHAIFNNLAGFLKYALKQSDPISLYSWKGEKKGKGEDVLNNFALTVPIMARLAKHVGELSIREIRKSKMEHFLIPYGTLWFNHSGTPNGTMFPKGLGMDEMVIGRKRYPSMDKGAVEEEEELNRKMVNVMMIRIAQNMMFVDMLRRNAQDVVLVRKSMPRFFMPSAEEGEGRGEDGRILELSDFVPFKKRKEAALGTGKAEKLLDVLSLILARSYVTLVAQVFRCMSRNSSDREEIVNFVDGLNRILLAHGDDIGIVGHVLIAFMVATARFRRLFTSGGGYALFMPALAKVYAEFHQRIDITLAIEYAVHRFYALHREVFLFQSLDAIASVVALPETNAKEYTARIYDLFYSLRPGAAPTNVDPAGIQGINQLQERQAFLFRAADEAPQTFLTAIRRGDAQTNGQIFFEVPDPYENSRLKMEDFVKLFLTIIAHDPNILRAQHFMRMFRHLTFHLYNASTHARNVLQEGLVALSNIMLRTFSKSKAGEASGAVRVGEFELVDESEGGEKNASNPNVMRLDFLFALTGVGEAGCLFPPQMVRKAIDIAKLILRDAPLDMLEPLSIFFADLAKLVVLRGELSKLKYVKPFLQDITPIIRQYTTVLDLTSVFETFTKISTSTPYAHDVGFARLLTHEVCSAGLDACIPITSDTTEGNVRFTSALVSLLAESVFLRGADVIAELEKRRPSLYFLTRVMLPLVLSLKTTDELNSDSGKLEVSHRTALTSSWIRLLLYAMTACQKSFRASESLPLNRSRSREKRSDDEKKWQTPLSTYTMSLQIIKIIVIRAEIEISTASPDLWSRLAVFMKSALMDGNAKFALRPSGFDEGSPSPSPTPSPRGSIHLNRSGKSPLLNFQGLCTPLAQPRVIDYALWSVLEFLCKYRSPLRLQLHLFTVEKVVSLDQELKPQQRRMSHLMTLTTPFASPTTSPMSRRVSASIFAKPRRSTMFSPADSSPHGSRSPSMIHVPSTPSIYLTPGGSLRGVAHPETLETHISIPGGELRLPGYQYVSPTISPSGYIQDGQGPRILHLGPTSPSALIPPAPLSPSGGGSMGVSKISLLAQSTKIHSPAMIRMTYHSIREVQAFMGYDTLLPMPILNAGLGISGIGMDNDEVSVATWTTRSALQAILKEVKLLEEEFMDLPVHEKLEEDDVFNEKVMYDFKGSDEESMAVFS